MNSILMKAVLFLSIASLTAATTAEEKPAQSHTAVTLAHKDVKPQYFMLDLNCDVSNGTNPSELTLSCEIQSAKKVPGHIYNPTKYRMEIGSETPADIKFWGYIVHQTNLQPFTVSQSSIPSGERLVVMMAGCWGTLKEWKDLRRPEADYRCKILEVRASRGL
ncbi:b373e955-eda9-455b-8c4b-6891148774fd [Sclerotinia trifoliorum]|uniref:B373e955-eda9-455b-8c4b-6891148774fd n=1 Tax=Sclerotinia trifoliorum TaxID=28548 RepID=A0A8H2VRS6_9HELO|nr:b373e955-eda9-455b-8c4b-6891148774fd [Sclerotinia trifoliorum]